MLAYKKTLKGNKDIVLVINNRYESQMYQLNEIFKMAAILNNVAVTQKDKTLSMSIPARSVSFLAES